MSIHNIPDRYLNTTLHFFRESFEFDEVGDLSKVAQTLAYASVKGNVQAVGPGTPSTTEYHIQGKVYIQSHTAYINRFDSGAEREILPGDIVYDQETLLKYIVLGTEDWQSQRQSVTDSHHIKVKMRAISGVPKDPAVVLHTMEVKGNVVEPGPEPLGINVGDSATVIDRLG